MKELIFLVNNEVAQFYPVKYERSFLYINNRFGFKIRLVIFDKKTQLGFFNSHSMTIGISKKLMYEAHQSVLINVLRHELAHFFVYVFNGPNFGHRFEFRDFCKKLNWGPEVYLAYSNLNLENESHEESEVDKKTKNLIEKIKKLLALGSSSNIYESELATSKANQLLTEHNLEIAKNIDLGPNSQIKEEEFCSLEVLHTPKANAKLNSIASILETFFVKCILVPGENNGTAIEVVGDKTSVLLAEYVANFLNYEFDNSWKLFKKSHPEQKGIASKNSFFRGIAKGYVEKINLEKNKHLTGNELVVINDDLNNKLKMAFPNLQVGGRSYYKHNESAHSAGVSKGKNLSINKAVSNSSSQTFYLN